VDLTDREWGHGQSGYMSFWRGGGGGGEILCGGIVNHGGGVMCRCREGERVTVHSWSVFLICTATEPVGGKRIRKKGEMEKGERETQ